MAKEAVKSFSSSAVLSADYRYRYELKRRLHDIDDFPVMFIMLNPSTADAFQDDPTIRRCKAFAKREKASELLVVNLFAYRATDPKDLVSARLKGVDIVGSDNDRYLIDAAKRSALIICAWGSHPAVKIRGSEVSRMLIRLGNSHRGPLLCLGKTKDGFPRHPLYVRADAPLVPYP